MKKGFTLIELLAVIVILAVIALISTPIIIGLIDDARKEAFKSSAYGIIKAGELMYSKDLLDRNPEEVTFTYTNGMESSSIEGKRLDYNGSKPQKGQVKINKEGQVAVAIHNGTYCAEKGYSDSEVTISDKTKEECITPFDIAWIYIDSDSSGTVNVGEEITFGTESFYVISNDGNNIKALAKYNLYVGGTYDSDLFEWTAYGIEATGLQDSEMRGYVEGQTVINGTTPFSSDDVKGTNYSDYAGSIVEGYLESYESVLNGLGANIQEATLITKEELESLGCSSTSDTCSSAPDFVKETSYWSGSAYSADSVWGVFSFGDFNCLDSSYDNYFGVRPVITISSSEI